MGEETDELLERAGEVTELRAAVADARRGTGGLVLIEGPAGTGKTELLRRLRRLAADDGLRITGAVAGELERGFPFGVVRQLLEPLVAAAEPARRAALFTGAAAAAEPVVGGIPATEDPTDDTTFTVLHGLYWLVAGLAEPEPLALVVDDLHWADDSSLRALEFLARRAADSRVLLAVAARTDEPGAPALLDALHALPSRRLEPRPLSRDGAARLLAGAPDPVIDAAAEATGGNPLLLRELAVALAPLEATTPAAVLEAVPHGVVRRVRARLERLSPQAREVGRALAVLGDGRPPALLAAATGLEPRAVAPAVEELVRAGLVLDGPPRHRHPLVRAAVAGGVPVAARSQLHERAARRLAELGQEEEAAVHLLATAPLHEAWAGELLRRAARTAGVEGAPDVALARLRRAREELGRDEELELELATAALAAGDPAAREHLVRARVAERPAVRARAAAALLAAGLGADEGADELLAATLPRLDPVADADLHDRLAAALITLRSADPSRADRRAATLAALADGGPLVLSHRVFEAAATDATAPEILALAGRALGGGVLRDVAELHRPHAMWALIGLTSVDAATADAGLRDAEHAVRARPSRTARAFVAFIRGQWHLAHGDVVRAEDESREALALMEACGNTVNALAVRADVAAALVWRGELDEADALLAMAPPDEHFRHFWGGPNQWVVRGQLRLAQRRPAEAVTELRKVAAECERYGWQRYPYGAATALLAQALIAAGETGEGIALARAEADEQARRGAHRLRAEALLALADAEPAAAADAHAAAEAAGAPVLRARAALAHGSALRRGGGRTAARRLLGEARDLAHRAGATAVTRRAEDELLVAGGRPRRTATTGVDALTPSERRMAEHAAAGLSNREIAEVLFVTRKTVETTLGHVYAKLGIRSRTQLPAALERG